MTEYKTGDRIIIILNNSNFSMLYIDEMYDKLLNEEITYLGGTVLSSERKYFHRFDEHDHGHEIYTLLGDDGKTYVGSTFSSEYVCNCIVTDKESLIKDYERHIDSIERNIVFMNKKLKSKIDNLELMKSYKEQISENNFTGSLVLGKKIK